MVAALVGDLLSWIFVVALTVVALTITIVGTLRMYQKVQGTDMTKAVAVTLVAGTAVVLFLGGWLVVGLYWAATWCWQTAARRQR